MFVNQIGQKFFSKEIHDAIRENDKQTLCELIVGVNLNEVRNDEGTTLLHLSVRMRSKEMVRFFIENCCDVNSRDRMRTTPLLYALKINYYPAIKLLLEAKADFTISDRLGTNILEFILTNHHANRLELIELFGKHIKKSRFDTKELALLIQEAKWPIHYAIYIEDSELIKLMLEAGCDVDSYDEHTDNNTALYIAVLNTDTESIKVLLQHRADPDIITNRKSQSPFSFALKNPKALEAFLDHRDSLLERFNSDGKMASFRTFSTACYKVIELLLLKYKINLRAKDSHGKTFLHYVVLNRNRGIVNLLSKIYFDANIRDDSGDTLLHTVVGHNYLSCMEMLIDKDADINAENNNGDLPLTTAISCAVENELKILIENGAILNEEMQNRILTEALKNNIAYSIIILVLKRMTILNLQGDEISERNLSLIKSLTDFELWENFLMFSKELQVMKSDLINGNISVFDILSAPEKKILKYAQNEIIIDLFVKVNFQFCYPNFGNQFKKRFEFAIVKQNLIQQAIDILSKNIEQLKCNSQVIENIVKYLSLNDLERLQISSPPIYDRVVFSFHFHKLLLVIYLTRNKM